ncbi:MAG TPA: serine hydrolase domain-containing protein [Prolixibacteraceae bacterium]|mgnify:CR=1 FL=1|nr:serine hydrolase domain-containing protein [Prolixibacteraceae bacterium]
MKIPLILRKHSGWWLSLLLIVFTLAAGAQTKSLRKSPPLTPGTPESAGMSSERVARIDAMLQEKIDKGVIPGAVALVARNGRIVYHKAFGTSDTPSGKKMEANDIFRIASQTKAITSTAVMMLWEEGKFSLDDPISKYIPEFKNPRVLQSFRYSDTSYTTIPAVREITIRHLLTHTSGIGYGAIDGDERFRLIFGKAGIIDAFTTENELIADNVKKLARMPLHHQPGEKYTYGEGLDVLGYFIEIMSGIPFDQFLRTRLFDPLGMNDTWFYLPQEKAGRLVKVQVPDGNGSWKPMEAAAFFDPGYPVSGARTFFSGGAGLSSTARDYATFLQMYLNGGELNGVRILSRTTVETILVNQVGDLFQSPDRYYGLAFGVLTAAGEAKGGKGSEGLFDWGGYFNTQYFADPVEKTIGILMKQTQGTSGDDTEMKFRLLIGQAIDD